MDHLKTKVCILVCTCDRPAFLEKLLVALISQVQDDQVIVVDNGSVSSEAVVSRFRSRLNVIHDRLAEPGLVAARNRSITCALQFDPEYLVFIDDDEVPDPGWLSTLVGRLEATGADIATGPVLAEFLAPPPAWVVKGAFFIRGPGTATGNLALRRTCLPSDPNEWFNPAFNFIGAEDEEFLTRLMANGARYVAAEAAIVREFVPASRLRRRYIWRLGLRDGLQIAQLNAIRLPTLRARVQRAALGCLTKVGYGCNHLFWSIFTPWRITLCVRDFAAVAGILFGVFGIRPRFYGPLVSPVLSDAGQGT